MGEIFTPYSSRERAYEPRAIGALEKCRGIEELLLGWISEKRSLCLTTVQPTDTPQSGALDVAFSRSGRRVAGGTINLDYLMSFVPGVESVAGAIDSTGAPNEAWFDARNEQFGIELDPEYDLNRCPPRALSPLVLSYLVNPRAVCTVRSVEGSHPRQFQVELLYLASDSLESLGGSERIGLGWKEQFVVHRAALENFVPHVYWV